MSDESLQVRSTQNQQLGSWSQCSRRGPDFWHARRAFLNSYHLTLETSHGGFNFKEKLKKSVKEVNDAAVGLVLDLRGAMSNSRLGIKVFRVTLSLRSLVLVTMTCFMPWINKREIKLHVVED
ncbi:hypothetical protein L6164_023901 [Bauhinia variegata]|uniref:Uncharacterized protein n=1 Tax=Bauhinia variegata TaxID=167791 RepID=A0ACB9MLY0_BAUVA|nr:hypothetical protein L6164_023901 [Bauhinia variegata]